MPTYSCYIGVGRVRASFKISIQLHLVLLKFKIHYALCQQLPYISVMWIAFPIFPQAPVSVGFLWYVAIPMKCACVLGLRFDLHYAQVHLHRLTIALLKGSQISQIQHLVHLCFMTFNSCHIWGLLSKCTLLCILDHFLLCVQLPQPLCHCHVQQQQHPVCPLYAFQRCVVRMYRHVHRCKWSICLSGAICIARSACVGAHTKCPNLFLPFTNAVGCCAGTQLCLLTQLSDW